MNYYELQVGETTYKLKLTARELVKLEKSIGGSPINLFMKMNQEQSMPELDGMLLILHHAIVSYQKNVDVYELFDNFVDEGGDLTKLIEILVEVMKVSGLFPKEEKK